MKKYSWIKTGAKCKWCDPDIKARDMHITWTIVDIYCKDGEMDDETIILIESEYGSQAEVWRTELKELKRLLS